MAAPSGMDLEFGEENDAFYALLNVSRDASNEEISNAYRRLGRIFHPDKHMDPSQKKDAENVFNKLKRAKDVLSNPHLRAVYDTVGLKGLEEIEGKEIVPVYGKSPKEIREEYERLVKDSEERRAQQSTNPRGTISVGVDATDVFDRYDAEVLRSGFPHIEINNMSISQSVEAPLTDSDTAVLAGSLSTQNGTGSGTIIATVRRVLSVKSWAEMEVAAGNGAAFSLKGFRTLSRRTFGTLSGSMQFTPHGAVRPSVSAMFAMQLDRNIQGRLTWLFGMQSALNSTVIWDTQENHLGIAFQLGIPNCFVSVNYAHKFQEQEAKIKVAGRISTFVASVEYGFEKKISRFSTLGATLVVGVPIGVTLRLKLNRGNQNYAFPIHLSDELMPSAIFYGTVLPIAAYCVIKVLLVSPFMKEQKEKELQKQKEANAEKIRAKKKEAEAEMELMKETAAKSRRQEENCGGVVIVKAHYGKLVAEETREENQTVVDVIDPVQLLVKDSAIKIPADTRKSNLPGFYDPCIGEEKSLYIRYKFHGQLHEMTVGENEALKLPKQEHLIRTT